MSFTETTAVPTIVGDLRAGLWVPDGDGPWPGIVLVDGSGDGTFDDWDSWAARYRDCAAIVLGHDKPGCGSPGDWTQQTLADRADESLAALAVLRRHPGTAGRPVGFLGVSQGGWVSLLAAAAAAGTPAGPDFVITMSGPGVSPARQEVVRITNLLVEGGYSASESAEALAWIDERTRRLLDGDDPAAILAAQQAYADRRWYADVTRYIDTAAVLGFLARIADFDPAPILPRVSCPVFGAFGGADSLVPAGESIEVYARNLNWEYGSKHALAVFPGANHGLFIAPPDPAIPRTSQLAPGYLAMVAGFVDRVSREYVEAASA